MVQSGRAIFLGTLQFQLHQPQGNAQASGNFALRQALEPNQQQDSALALG